MTRERLPGLNLVPNPDRAEQPLRVLAEAMDRSASVVATLDPEGHLSSANQTLLRFLGRSQADVCGKPVRVVLAADNAPALANAIAESCLTGTAWQGECLLAAADSTRCPVILTIDPIQDAAGRHIGSVAIAHPTYHGLRDETAPLPREEPFRQLAEHIQQVFFVLSVRPPRTIYLSPAYEDIFGRSRPSDDRLGDPLSSAIHSDDRASTSKGFARAAQGIPSEGKFRILRPDGEVRWLHARLFPVYDADGIFYRIVGLCEDVTVWKQKERELREARDRLREAMRTLEREADEARALSDLIDVLQSCHNVDEAYQVAGRTLPMLVPGGSGALYITRPSRDMLEAVAHWGDDPSIARPFAPDACWALRRGKMQRVDGSSSPAQCDHVDASSSLAYVCVPLVAQGEPMGVLHVRPKAFPVGHSAPADALEVLGRHAAVIGERISLVFANLALRDVLRRQSIRDPLTRLFNRRYMEDSLSRECGRASRYDQPLAVAMLDIDQFKHVNDEFGHQAGDVLLRAIGDLLQRQTRAENVACRYGGEEFAVILSNASVDDASKWAARFREDLKSITVRHLGEVLGPVTVSVGIAGFPAHGTTGEALIKIADAALYQAKREGRDRVVVAGCP